MKKIDYLLVLILLGAFSGLGWSQPEIMALKLTQSAAESISNLKAEVFTLDRGGILTPGRNYVIQQTSKGFSIFPKRKKKPEETSEPDDSAPVVTIHCSQGCDPCSAIETPGNSGETIVTCGTCDRCQMYARVPNLGVIRVQTPDGWRDYSGVK